MSQIVQSRDAANPLAVFQETAIHRTWHQEERVGCGEGQTASYPHDPSPRCGWHRILRLLVAASLKKRAWIWQIKQPRGE